MVHVLLLIIKKAKVLQIRQQYGSKFCMVWPCHHNLPSPSTYSMVLPGPQQHKTTKIHTSPQQKYTSPCQPTTTHTSHEFIIVTDNYTPTVIMVDSGDHSDGLSIMVMVKGKNSSRLREITVYYNHTKHSLLQQHVDHAYIAS